MTVIVPMKVFAGQRMRICAAAVRGTAKVVGSASRAQAPSDAARAQGEDGLRGHSHEFGSMGPSGTSAADSAG